MLGFLVRKTAFKLNLWFLCITALEIIALLFLSGNTTSFWATPLVLLIAVSGALCVLGRHLNTDTAFDLFEILILMGLGFGFILSPAPVRFIFLGGIFALLILMLLRTAERTSCEVRWLIGLYGTGIVLLIASSFFAGESRNLILVLVYATLLPLFPLHGAYSILLKRLSGTLPAFLSLFLPALGIYGLLPLLPLIPPGIKQILLICAILGMIVAALRSLVQIRLTQVLSQIAIIFWSILWCYFASSNVAVNPALLFFGAASLALCGFFLMAHGLNARYGALTMDQFSGLASVMPRFSVLFVLFCMAGMGLPFFGIFSGFMAMSFSSTNGFSWPLIFTLLAWIFAAWRFPTLMETLLFGPPKQHWIHQDFGLRETTALTLILILLFILGVSPHLLFDLESLALLGGSS